MIKTIIFDVGGTLVNAPDIFREIAQEIKRIHNIEVEKELRLEFELIYSGSVFYTVKAILDNAVKKILRVRGIKILKIAPSRIYYDVFVNKSELFDDAKEVLEYLKKKNIELIILSDADSDVLVPELERLGIIKYFKKIIISSELCCYKTSKEIVKCVDPLLGANKKNALFVGDSSADINAAKKLGIRSVFINRSSEEKKGDITIHSLSEIKKLILHT